MKRIWALTAAVAMTVAACGGSDETAPEPDVEVEAVDDDGTFRFSLVGVQVVNGCRIEPRTQCPGADLSGADLAFANLWGADLTGANLSNAWMEGAFLRDADLYGANLWEAILSGVNLSGADLERVNLRGARLWRADLRDADLMGADLRGADLWGARFCNTRMPDGTVRNDNC